MFVGFVVTGADLATLALESLKFSIKNYIAHLYRHQVPLDGVCVYVCVLYLVFGNMDGKYRQVLGSQWPDRQTVELTRRSGTSSSCVGGKLVTAGKAHPSHS